MFPYPTCEANTKTTNIFCLCGTTVVLCDPVLTGSPYRTQRLTQCRCYGLVRYVLEWAVIGHGEEPHCPVKPWLSVLALTFPPQEQSVLMAVTLLSSTEHHRERFIQSYASHCGFFHCLVFIHNPSFSLGGFLAHSLEACPFWRRFCVLLFFDNRVSIKSP